MVVGKCNFTTPAFFCLVVVVLHEQMHKYECIIAGRLLAISSHLSSHLSADMAVSTDIAVRANDQIALMSPSAIEANESKTRFSHAPVTVFV